MGNLSVKVGSLSFENPFLLASAPPSASYELIRKAFSLGWGGAVTKTIKSDDMLVRDVSPRFAVVGSRQGDVYGFENFELVSKRSLGYWEESIAKLKAEWPGRVLIASIMGDSQKESWQELSRRVQAAGADALELNFSCPHGMPEMGVGAAIGQNPDISARITGWVAQVAKVPVIVKLTPNVTDVRAVAKAVEAAGADMLAAINTVESLSGIDLESLEPKPSVAGHSTFGGYSGKAVKPIGLRVVAQLAKASSLPIMGMGGISDWRDAGEYIAVGAAVVQVCTEVMLKGMGIIESLTQGLSGYLDRKAFPDLGALRGQALARISSHESLDRSTRMVARVDGAKCVACGRCQISCADGGHQAIQLRLSRAEIDAAKCDGCSLCVHVCPTAAIGMAPDKVSGGARSDAA